MSCFIRHISYSATATLSRHHSLLTRGPSFAPPSVCVAFGAAWGKSMWVSGTRVPARSGHLTGRWAFGVRCLAAARRSRGASASRKGLSVEKEESSALPGAMEGDAFYVVRKGDVIGVFKSLSDCQDQVSSSVCDPSVSVYKGYSLQKETEEYLVSRGLKDALYSINAADCQTDLFGTLVPCPFQQPPTAGLVFSSNKVSKKTSSKKRPLLEAEFDNVEVQGPSSRSIGASKLVFTQDIPTVSQTVPNHLSCIIEFDGASKGNPGKAGAGVVVRREDGSIISQLREGLGIVTNNVAEYKSLILGMKYALRKGFKKVLVQGDSMLVCMQVQDKWQTKHQNLIDLCKEAKELKNKFLSFQICHVKREFNSDADAQANFAINLPSGEVSESAEMCQLGSLGF